MLMAAIWCNIQLFTVKDQPRENTKDTQQNDVLFKLLAFFIAPFIFIKNDLSLFNKTKTALKVTTANNSRRV